MDTPRRQPQASRPSPHGTPFNAQLRLIAATALAGSALFTGSTVAAPGNVPAPHAGCDYVRGVSATDSHEKQTGKGHSLHGNGWGYGHGSGDAGDGGSTGGGGTDPVFT